MLQAKAEKLTANGQAIPLKLANELTAAHNPLDFQLDRLRATTEEPLTAEAKADQELLLSSYETDMSAAILRMQRMHGVNRQLAMELVQQLIDTKGIADVLPQHARIAARMQAKYPKS